MMRNLILSMVFGFLPSVLTAGPFISTFRLRGKTYEMQASYNDGECSNYYVYMIGYEQAVRVKGGKEIGSTAIDELSAYYEEYNYCDETYSFGQVTISPAGLLSNGNQGASVAVPIDVQTINFQGDFLTRSSLELNVVWIPSNGKPTLSKSSYSSPGQYSSFRTTSSGMSVEQIIELSIVKDGTDLEITDWSIFGTVVRNNQGTLSKIEDQSCSDLCGSSGVSNGATCFCDAVCAEYGDCCEGYIYDVAVCNPDRQCSDLCNGDGVSNGVTCSCNAFCAENNDCCEGYTYNVGVCNPDRECSDLCGSSGVSNGVTCYCDAVCAEYGDCCEDYIYDVGVCNPDRECSDLCNGDGVSNGVYCKCDAICACLGNCCEGYIYNANVCAVSEGQNNIGRKRGSS